MGPRGGTAVEAIALFSTTNTVLILLVSTSRLLYGVSKAEYRSFPTVFSRPPPPRAADAPPRGVARGGRHGAGHVPRGQVAGLANLVLFVVFVLVNAALLKLRLSESDHPGGFRVPVTVGRVPLPAVAGVLSSLGLMVFYLLRLV